MHIYNMLNFSKSDVVRLIRLLKRRKALGLDGTTPNHLQNVSALLIDHLTPFIYDHLTQCIDTGQAPNSFGCDAVINIFKEEKTLIFGVFIALILFLVF